MKHLLCILLLTGSSMVAQPLKNGDLLFVASVVSGFEQAIAEVTNDESQQNFSHIAMVNVTDSGVYVVEATPKHGVIYRTISEFEQENFEKYMFIGRLKHQYQQGIPDAIRYACSHLGKPYDFAFDFDNDDYYCSELIYVAFMQESESLFEVAPMTFKLSENGDFLPYWVEYFAQLNIPIPEGKPGLNPNGMSRSEKLEPLKKYKP
ncbi:MAG: hypothetical protein FWG79_07050 [Bacteroidales bacterium]|nr:hypothetical protein [Bacteroidales bacterium]